MGHWYDRTREHAARQRNEKDVDEAQFASEERLVFSPLPCWAHLPEAEWRRRVAELVEETEQEGVRERKRTKSHRSRDSTPSIRRCGSECGRRGGK